MQGRYIPIEAIICNYRDTVANVLCNIMGYISFLPMWSFSLMTL